MNDLPCETSSFNHSSLVPETLPGGTVFSPSEQNGEVKKNAKKKKETNIGSQKEVSSCQLGKSEESQKSQNVTGKKKSQNGRKGSRKATIAQKSIGDGKKRNVGGGIEKRLTKGLIKNRFCGPYNIPEATFRKAAVAKRMRNSQDLDVKTTLFLLTTIIDAFQNKLKF